MRGRAHTSPEQREGICAGHAIPGQCCQSGLGLAHTFSLIVVPETVLVVPQAPVYYVAAPYASCIWCDELGCVRQTLDFCAMFAGS